MCLSETPLSASCIAAVDKGSVGKNVAGTLHAAASVVTPPSVELRPQSSIHLLQQMPDNVWDHEIRWRPTFNNQSRYVNRLFAYLIVIMHTPRVLA